MFTWFCNKNKNIGGGLYHKSKWSESDYNSDTNN